MSIFESFKKGMDVASNDVSSNKKESNLINFETINQQILDKSINNTTVVLNIKKFMATSLNPNETNQIIESFIKNRPEARDILLNK